VVANQHNRQSEARVAGFDGRAIANYILDYCEKRGRDVTNLGLQKIVFFCHVWSLIRLNAPLIRHQFEAWEHGPVLPYLYREFKKHDRTPITSRAIGIDPISGELTTSRCELDDATEKLLGGVIEFYSQLSAGQLVEMSHVKGGPWENVWNHDGKINPGMRIDNQKIIEFYSRAIQELGIQ
jgi:uncharacterized phage-associated protein